MAFNPNEPQNGEVVDADFLRGQFNDLNARQARQLPEPVAGRTEVLPLK